MTIANIIVGVGTLRKPHSGRYIFEDSWFVGVYMYLFIPFEGLSITSGRSGAYDPSSWILCVAWKGWVGGKIEFSNSRGAMGICKVAGTGIQSYCTSNLFDFIPTDGLFRREGHMFFWSTKKHMPTKENAKEASYCFILLESMLGMLILILNETLCEITMLVETPPLKSSLMLDCCSRNSVFRSWLLIPRSFKNGPPGKCQ